MKEFTIAFQNTQCPYFYDGGYYCFHLSVQGRCKKEACPMINNDDKTNQCDGCRRGLPINDKGVHYNPDGSYDHIVCTKDRYQ